MPDFLRPPGLFRPPGYSHIVKAGNLLFVAGQVGVGEDNEPVSLEFPPQCERAFRNLGTCLGAAGADYKDVVKLTVFLRNQTDIPALRETMSRYFPPERPPANTLLIVAALARPYLLFEVEAIAVVE